MTDTDNTSIDDTMAGETEWNPPIIKDTPEGADLYERVPYDDIDYDSEPTDWATDIDHGHPSYNKNAHQIWHDVREGGCPVAHTDRYGGMWAPLTHETVHEIAYDTDNFTSRSVVVGHLRPGDLQLPAPIGGAPPITSDPPFHQMARRLLLPAFSPEEDRASWEDEVRPALPGPPARRHGRHRRRARPMVDAAVQYSPAHPGQP